LAGQRRGTSGLRQKVRVFREPGYVEAFVQSLFEALSEAAERARCADSKGNRSNANVKLLAALRS
jgi:phosphoglucomutase